MHSIVRNSVLREGSTMVPSAEELKILKLAFNTVDKHNVGRINADQLQGIIAELAGPEEAEECLEGLGGALPALMDHLDVDNDGMLTVEELSKLAEYGTTANLPKLLITAVIYAADKDNNGHLRAILKIIKPEVGTTRNQKFSLTHCFC